MPLRSMTGHGTAARTWQTRADDVGCQVLVEVRAVNGRYRELKIRQPFGLDVELDIRRRIEAVVGRGRIDVFVRVDRSLEDAASPGPRAALSALGAERRQIELVVRAVAEIEEVAGRAGLQLSAPDPVDLLRLALGARAGSPVEVGAPAFFPELLDEAVAAFDRMRLDEGVALEAALRGWVGRLASTLQDVTAATDGEGDRLESRVRQRLEQITAAAAVPGVDVERIRQEVALLLVRGDTAEEQARIASHLAQLDRVLTEPATPGQGKTLDFLCQELSREVNTIGSKITSHHGSGLLIEAKAIVERIREQVQNVE